MKTESDKRAAALAVARYGADQILVRGAYHATREARARGEPADLVHTLVTRKLLTSSQAEELRQNLDTTRLDPKDPGQAGVRREADGAAPNPGSDANGQSGHHPRSLGDYRVLRRIGEGGMGAVYLGYHEGQGRHVAIKVLADALAHTPAYLDRFLREARSGAVLEHPNLVGFIGAGQDSALGKHYLVLEYVDGPSARTLLDRYGRLPVGDAVHVILDIARALEHLHAHNFVHRDIKPDNVLITRSGVAKLADLGLAKRVDDVTHLTGTRQSVGTPFYMPYEQVISAKQVDGRSDIYALGATLYHLVTGDVPFPGQTALEVTERKVEGIFKPASAVNPAVPRGLDRALDKMLARHPRDRYQTASELIIDLERTRLAPPVPSFVDPDAAYQDPLVRARLTSPAQSTHADLRVPARLSRAQATDIWYLRYRNRDGRWCKAKASTQQLILRLREGRVPSGLEIGRDAKAEFRCPADFPEFRSILPPGAAETERSAELPAPKARSGLAALLAPFMRTRRRIFLTIGVCCGVVASAGLGYYWVVLH